MGADFYAVTVIGVELHVSRIEIKRKIKSFAHDYPESYQFDPKNGKPLWYMQSCILPELENEKGLHIFKIGNEGDDGKRYIGYYLMRSSENNMVHSLVYNPVDLGDQRDALRKLLLPLGLWGGDNAFRIWSLFDFSC